MRRWLYIILSLVITAGIILLGVFVFSNSYLRLWESAKDLGLSAGFFFCEMFGIEHSITPTVINSSKVMAWDILLPEDFETFKINAGIYFTLLVNKDNFMGWFNYVSIRILNALVVIIITIVVLKLFVAIMKKIYGIGNTKHNKDTMPLKIFKTIMKVTYQPVKRLVLGYIAFLQQYERIWTLWLLALALHVNLGSIVLEFFAYIFYFVTVFDFTTIYPQIVKLVIDLQVILRYFPWWIITFVLWVLFLRYRKRIAKNKLRHYEARNCGFVNELPIVSITCGSMGKKKTTVITDMVLSQEVMFRQKAFEILQRADMKFPYFPWICLEDELRLCMEYHTVYNLATVKQWIAKKRERYYKHGNSKLQLYGYDCERYGMSFNDTLRISNLFDILETYSLAYFIYVIQSSLVLANYSIRTDNVLFDEGNFPVWISDFFPEGITEGRHAHILDFDVLRLGKKMIAENPNIGSFEFGVVAITEIGKERGNNLELKEIKKTDIETNQKNDLFNSWLKMCRHSATVDNFPFVKVFTDEQRAESWGADARDLCDVVHIASSGEQKLALPFYTIEDMLAEWSFNSFINLYYDFRFKRGDNTLFVYLLKGITAWIWKRNIRVYNSYGYSITKIEKERGTLDGKIENKKYYIMNKKIYARRFTTDCFSDYFNDMATKTKIGINDYREYATEKATVEELKLQNSYFINSLY